MELAGAPLGEDLLRGLGCLAPLGEHMFCGLGQRTLDTAEDGLGAAGDGCVAGDGGGAPEWPGRVGGRV